MLRLPFKSSIFTQEDHKYHLSGASVSINVDGDTKMFHTSKTLSQTTKRMEFLWIPSGQTSITWLITKILPSIKADSLLIEWLNCFKELDIFQLSMLESRLLDLLMKKVWLETHM